MRVTQAVLETQPNEYRVYWLDDDPYNDRGLEVGQRVMLAEEGVTSYLKIKQLLVSVSDETKEWLIANLKARMGTILELG